MDIAALQNLTCRQVCNTMLLIGVLLLLTACATTQPGPDEDMYALSAMEAMTMMRNIKDHRARPNNTPVTCTVSADSQIEIYLADGFVIEEYWITRRDNRLYLGVQHEFGRKLFELSDGRLYTIVEPTYFTHSINETTWARFWLGEIAISDVGENRITGKVAYDGGDELMEKIGTTKIKIFLDPVYSFLDTYYAAETDISIKPVILPLNTDNDCENPSVEGVIVGK